MTESPDTGDRVIVIAAGAKPFAVVFEMYADPVVIVPDDSIRLILARPPHAQFKIAHGDNGCSVFREI